MIRFEEDVSEPLVCLLCAASDAIITTVFLAVDLALYGTTNDQSNF